MGTENFKHILYAFILFAVVGVLLLTAVQLMADDYNKPTNTILAGALDVSSFTDSIADVENTSQTLRTQFEKQNPFSAIAGIIVTGLFDIGKSLVNLIITPFTLMGGLLASLGVPSILISIILGLLIIAILFGIWEVLTTSN
jgi:hypothetical protein